MEWRLGPDECLGSWHPLVHFASHSHAGRAAQEEPSAVDSWGTNWGQVFPFFPVSFIFLQAQFIKGSSQPATTALFIGDHPQPPPKAPILGRDSLFLISFPSNLDIQASKWWIHNYWWIHISSELLQSAHAVIVTEVICIKLIILCNKGHKSVHYQFTGKCFKHMFFYIVQGRKKGFLLLLPYLATDLHMDDHL